MFRTCFRTMQTPPKKILGPNPSAKNDPMVILSLSTFRGNVQFVWVFPIDMPLFREKSLFHFKPSGIYFEGFLFSPSAWVLADVFWSAFAKTYKLFQKLLFEKSVFRVDEATTF